VRKWKWAVVINGFEGADGTDYGVGMGAGAPHEILVAMTYSKRAAERECERLDAEAEPGKYWVPGHPYLRPTYSVRPYNVALGWSEQDADHIPDEGLHRLNLAQADTNKIRD
jgi:hypothetical protein